VSIVDHGELVARSEWNWHGGDDLLALAHDESNPFMLDDLICETVTLWYGQSEIGKSRLVVGLVAALLRGEPFLERQPNQPSERLVVLTGDSGGVRQYARRLFREEDVRGGSWAGLSAVEAQDKLRIRRVGTMRQEEWHELAQEVDDFDPDLVVIDPLSRVANGDTNLSTVADEFYSGVDLLGRTVLIVGHSSIKPDENGRRRGSQTPMGHSNWVNHSRWRVECLADESGQLGLLRASGNDADKMEVRLRRHDRLTDFSVLSETFRSTRVAEREDEANAHARWVVENCHGLSGRASGRRLAAEFALTSDRAGEKRMERSGTVGKLLDGHETNQWQIAS
jgi:hypothetical protein